MPPTVTFDGFRFDPASGDLVKDGEPRRLAPLPAKFLSLLVSRAGQLVGREEIRDALWGDQHLEWEKSLYHCVLQVRRALGDSSRHPRYVENVPKRGYRFLVQVRTLEGEAELSQSGSRTPRRSLPAALAGTLLLAWLAAAYWPRALPAPDSPAHSLVKQGEFLLERPSPGDFERARHLFLEAVQLDPNHSRAWSGLAHAQFYRFVRGQTEAPEVRASARKALTLDAANADALVVLGDLASLAEHDVESSGRYYEQALEHDPLHRRALIHYSSYLLLSGRPEDSLIPIERLLKNDPPSALLMGDAGWAYLAAARPSQAEDVCRQALRLEPDLPHARECLVYALTARGQPQAGLRAAESLLRLLSPEEDAPLTSLSDFHRRMAAWYARRPGTEIRQALHYAAMGDADSALSFLNHAAQEEQPQLILFLRDPRLRPLRASKEFQDLLRRFGLNSNPIRDI